MPLKRKFNQGPEPKKDESPVLSTLRQYLSRVSKKKENGKTPKKAKRIFVKKVKVNLGAKKKPTKEVAEIILKAPKKTKEMEVGSEIERSLQDYISRRSAYLNRSTGTLMKPGKAPKAAPPPVKIVAVVNAPKSADTSDVPIVGKLISVVQEKPAPAGAIPLDERIPVAQTIVPAAPTHIDLPETQAKSGSVFNLLRYLPFLSKTAVETAKRTDELEAELNKTKEQAVAMAQRFEQTERRLEGKADAKPADAVAPAAATAAPQKVVTVVSTSGQTATTAGPAMIATSVPTPGKLTAGKGPNPTSSANGGGIGGGSGVGATIHGSGSVSGGTTQATAPQAVEIDRKKILENEEKRAEILMMKEAKKEKKKSGAFAEFLASLEYMGMGKQRLLIIQNLGTMLNAGLPLIDSLHTLLLESKNRATKKLLKKIILAVDNGSPLWRAMDEQHFFSPHAIALIRIGEEAGNLAENMRYLAEQQEKDNALKEKVKMAMIYPSIVLVLMFIIVLGLGLFVLPQLIGVLKNLNAKLPLITILLIDFTDAFTTHAHIAIPSFIAFALFFVGLAKFTRFKIVTQWITFRIPGIGKLAREATLARFGVILGGLLQAGVPLVEALKSLAEVTPTVAYKNFYRRLLDHVNSGDSFARSFATIRGTDKILPISIQQLIITGEKTGSLSQIMLKISDIYEKEANNTAQKLPVILEPMILLGIGALVGTIAFAIIIPIYSIVGNVSGG